MAIFKVECTLEAYVLHGIFREAKFPIETDTRHTHARRCEELLC